MNQIFLGEDDDEPDAKKMKGSPYFVSELAYLLARCEEKMPFIFLGDEVSLKFMTKDLVVSIQDIVMIFTSFPNNIFYVICVYGY